MTNRMSIIKLLAVLAVAIMATGCNTMATSAQSMKYGKLYAMQAAFDDAVKNCADKETRIRALNWAVIGYNDLNDSRSYMDKRSQKYIETRALMRSVSTISSRRATNTEKMCSKIGLVASVSRDYLSNIESMSDEVIMISSIKY